MADTQIPSPALSEHETSPQPTRTDDDYEEGDIPTGFGNPTGSGFCFQSTPLEEDSVKEDSKYESCPGSVEENGDNGDSWLDVALSEGEAAKSAVLVSKMDRGKVGSRDYNVPTRVQDGCSIAHG